MKKGLIYALVLVLALSFTGCGVQEKAGEKIAEKAFEEAGGGELDIDGESYTIKGEDGITASFGDVKWPKTGLAALIPEFKGGVVNGVMDTPDSVVITLEAVQEGDAVVYSEAIKKAFPKNVYETTSSSLITVSGYDDAGINATVVYMEETLTVTVTKPQE